MRRTCLLLPIVAGCAADVHMPLHDACGPDDMTMWPALDTKPVDLEGQITPFDVDTMDMGGPAGSVYGKTPEIVGVPDGFGVDVLLQDYGEGASAKLVRIDRDQERFVATQLVDVPALARIMGLAVDDQGFRYVASGVEEGGIITDTSPAPGEYREDIVHVDKIDRDGEVVWTVDLDRARGDTETMPELVINPMVAATSRLAWGNGTVALLNSINTDFDGEVRHQKALTTHLDAATGEITRTASIWVSHSFDQRLIFDGVGFVELHLGDAYPRQIVMARVGPDSGAYGVMNNKGTTGDNNTYSRLGGVALIPPEVSEDFGYLVLFATESTSDVGSVNSRNVGLSRIRRDFETTDPLGGAYIDPALPDELISPVDGVDTTNHLQWLTHYEDLVTAERPSIVSVGCDVYVVLWEEWDGEAMLFHGTYGLAIDAAGDVLVEATKVTDHHLPRGDDPFELDNSAAWISGDATGKLFVNRVYGDLTYSRSTVD